MDTSASKFANRVRKRKKNHSRRNRTSERRELEIQADGLTKILVHRRDRDKCLKCGTDGTKPGNPLQAAHIFPKGKYPLLRFMLDNLLSLCYRDHIEWAHKDPIGFHDWIEAMWPGRIERLRISARMKRLLDLKELLIVLKDEVGQ